VLLSISGCKKTTEPICAGYAFYIPNSFNPNGDGLNDTFGPKGTGIGNFEMWMFDNNGSLIYHTTDINSQWDGIVQGGSGTICPQGNYLYKMTTTDECGNNHTYEGSVSLLK